MRSKFYLIATVMIMGVSGCSSANWNESGESVTISVGFGGFVDPIIRRYDQWSAEGKKIIVDGHVISADAFGAFGAANICYTENAIFSPHAASQLGIVPDYRLTASLTSRLPESLQEWFRNSGGYYDWLGFVSMEFPTLLEVWPEGACDSDTQAALERWTRKREKAEAESAVIWK